MQLKIPIILFIRLLSISTNATPLPNHQVQAATNNPNASPADANPQLLSSTHVCASTTSQPKYTNYTQPYTCSMKHDFAILGLYYDSCVPLNMTAATSSPKNHNNIDVYNNATSDSIPHPPPPSPLSNTILCCDETYTQPATFDALCIWGNGTNMAQWEAAGHPAGSLPTTSEEQMKSAHCLVGPIIHPKARCVQVATEDIDWGLGDLKVSGPGALAALR